MGFDGGKSRLPAVASPFPYTRGDWLRETLGHPDRRDALVAAVLTALVTFVAGWLATSPSWSMGINWDTAGYASEIARGTPWSRMPWNSHYGVGNVYWLAMHGARGIGLTALDGVRALNALAFMASALSICLCALHMGCKPATSVLVSMVYVSAWGTLALVFTWEDNVLFHPPALAALAIAVFRVGRWRWQDSLVAGGLVGVSSLMSWQGAAFALPICYAALFLPGNHSRWWQRLRDFCLVPAGLVLARFAWVCVFWVTSQGLPFADLLRTAFERPVPSYLPQGFSNWIGLLGKWREVLTHLGLGVTHELGPGIRDAANVVPHLKVLGAVLLGLSVLLWLVTNLLFRKKFSRVSRFVTTAFLALTLSSAAYLDFPADKYKRYDFVPMMASLGLAALTARLSSRRAGTGGWSRHLVLPLVVGLVIGQAVLAHHWHRHWHARLQMSGPVGRNSHGSQTWFAYLRSTRNANDKACSFVFAFHEVAHAAGNLEILASLFSELPHPLVIGAPPAAQQWIRPLPIVSTAEVRAGARGCEWLSPGARAELARLN
jgi:hypothetical protein